MKTSEKVLINKLNDVIERNFDNPLFGADEICRDLGVSRSQLYRLVKEHTQLSTSLYIRHRKLTKAKELLGSQDLKIAEIAYKLGIDSPQNFSKYFSQEFGLSPTDYRKNLSQKLDEPVLEQVETVALKQPSESNKPQKPDRRYWFAVAGAVVLLIAVGIYFLKPWRQKPLPGAGFSGNSIAILPFKNLGSAENAFFSDGIMQQIHGSLALISKLKVISTTSSNKYRNSHKLIPQIAEELHVNYIMEGSVWHLKDKIRVSLKLINAEDDQSVWAKNYDGDAKDLFSFMNTVSKEVAAELDQKLSDDAEERLNKIPTKNPEAYREYLLGRELIGSRTKEELEAGLDKFSKAIKLDPEFTMAYAHRSMAYYLLGDGGFLDEATQYRMSEQDALTAIRLDGQNGLAYANIANIYRDQKKWEQAKTAYQIALKHSPNDATINYWYAILLKNLGDSKGSLTYGAKAVALDPLSHVINCGYIWNLAYAGQLSEAKKKLDEGEILFDDSFLYYWAKGLYFVKMKDYPNAILSLEKSSQMNPRVKVIKYYTAFCKARGGRQQETLDFIKNLPDGPDGYVPKAVAYAGLKDKKQSLYYLQKAADHNKMPMDMKVFPFLDVLEGDPQFKAILKKFGLE